MNKQHLSAIVCICSNSSVRVASFIETNRHTMTHPLLDFILSTNMKNQYPEFSKIVHNKDDTLNGLRNSALDYCRENNIDRIIFIDDDIKIDYDMINAIDYNLKENAVVGVKLNIPTDYDVPVYISPNQYHYFAIHNDYTFKQNCVWGACMGIDLKLANKYQVIFDKKLGRRKKLLLSGGDTSFIKELITLSKGTKKILSNDTVFHRFNKDRLNLKWLTKRIFYQGITECVRSNMYFGLKKELQRNFSRYEGIVNTIFSVYCIFAFLFGYVYYIFVYEK